MWGRRAGDEVAHRGKGGSSSSPRQRVSEVGEVVKVWSAPASPSPITSPPLPLSIKKNNKTTTAQLRCGAHNTIQIRIQGGAPAATQHAHMYSDEPGQPSEAPRWSKPNAVLGDPAALTSALRCIPAEWSFNGD